ncbi:MAG TPA: NUDIX hydrolase [Azospirillaceae bacterium]|nr:NUDIX hydrolase [Azospirillaceae bacterium]
MPDRDEEMTAGGVDGPRWTEWARQLHTMAETGLTYSRDPYDIERYHAIQRIAREMVACGTGAAMERVEELFRHQIGHATPKVDVRAAVFRGDEILLVREACDGGWTLPGGFADAGESAADAARREVLEEAGYEVRITRLLALLDKARYPHPPLPYHCYKVFFGAEITGRAERNGLEVDGVGFFPVDRLPPLSPDRLLPEQVALIHRVHATGAPAAFD